MSFSIHIIHRAALISDSSALSQTPVELQDTMETGHGVPVYPRNTLVPNYTALWRRRMYVNALPRSHSKAAGHWTHVL